MHSNNINNIISAEMEYQQNRQNLLYDFSSVVIKYSKTIEQERLEQYISKYMSERKEIFEKAFLEVDCGFKENNSELITSSLSKINHEYGKELTHKSMDDFKDWLNN